MNQSYLLSRHRSAAPSRRGNLLIVSIVFVMIVASMGVVMLQMHTASSRRQLQATDNKRALYIAEAGLAEAFMAIAQGKSGNIGTAAQPALYADGIYWVEATPGVNDEVGLVSTGLCGTGRFALSVVLERQADTLASLGFYANQDVSVGVGALVDGYDSTAGTLAEQYDLSLGDTTGLGARVSAGGDILIEGGAATSGKSKAVVLGAVEATTVYGDARPGPNGVVSQSGSVLVTGSTAPLRQTTSLPAITSPPTDIVTPWRFDARGGTLPSGGYTMDAGTVGSGGTLRLEGPLVLVMSDLRIQGGATLQVDSSDGQVVIFIEDYLELADGSAVEHVNASPTGLAIFANGDQWLDRDGDRVPDPPLVFAPKGEFHGYLYSPATDLVLPGNLHFIGGLAANSLTIADGGRLTFDIALENTEVTAASLPKLVAWRIVELPEELLVDARTDPIQQLEAQGVTPLKSSEAAQDKYLYIKYYDSNGVARSYSGLESGLDYSTVDVVIGIMWDDDPTIGGEGQTLVSVPTLTKSRVVKSGPSDRSGK